MIEISVVIPTRNRADLLADTLESVVQQDLSSTSYEVLLVDNGSTDHTRQISDSYAAKLPGFRYIYDPTPGLHTGRHIGLLQSRGDILVFTDDDIEAFPTWLTSIRNAFTDLDVALVGGNNLPLFVDPPPSWLEQMWNQRSREGEKIIPWLSVLELSGSSRPFSPYYVWGCNFAIRKQMLLDAGGFHPDGMPPDLLRFRGDGETHVSRYVEHSGKICLFHPGASIYHKVTADRMTSAYFRQRGYRQGISDSYTALRAGKKSPGSTRSVIHRAAQWGRLRLKSLASSTTEVDRVLKEFNTGHSEGLAYHLNAYRDDAELREWVHKPQYFLESAV